MMSIKPINYIRTIKLINYISIKFSVPQTIISLMSLQLTAIYFKKKIQWIYINEVNDLFKKHLLLLFLIYSIALSELILSSCQSFRQLRSQILIFTRYLVSVLISARTAKIRKLKEIYYNYADKTRTAHTRYG